MDWKNDIKTLCEKGCTDSDIEDYLESHSVKDCKTRDVWDYVSELNAPTVCKCCKHIQMHGMHPCINCSRVPRQDYYEARQNDSFI